MLQPTGNPKGKKEHFTFEDFSIYLSTFSPPSNTYIHLPRYSHSKLGGWEGECSNTRCQSAPLHTNPLSSFPLPHPSQDLEPEVRRERAMLSRADERLSHATWPWKEVLPSKLGQKYRFLNHPTDTRAIQNRTEFL